MSQTHHFQVCVAFVPLLESDRKGMWRFLHCASESNAVAAVLYQAAQEQSDPSVNAHKSDGSEAVDITRVAQFTFGGHVPVGQDIMLGDCSTTSTDVLKPCEWRVGPSEAKGIAKYRIFF